MKIAIIGATGMVGTRIASEAKARGHLVTAVARSEGRAVDLPEGILLTMGDATNPVEMDKVFAANDIIVVATRPPFGHENTVANTIRTLLDSALNAKRRIIVVGGAAPLKSPRGDETLVIDDARYVPAEWRTIAQASVDQLRACETHAANWTYLSPPSVLEPGERKGTYRRGGTTLLVDRQGHSRISAEDLAVAILDEIEVPQVGEGHFTVAY